MNLLLERYEDARNDFNKAVALNPGFAIAVVQKCYADYRYALMTQNVALMMENMKSFREATERFPSCSEAFVLYGQVPFIHPVYCKMIMMSQTVIFDWQLLIKLIDIVHSHKTVIVRFTLYILCVLLLVTLCEVAKSQSLNSDICYL